MWKWKNKILKEVPDGQLGFVYKITEIKTELFYIGKKQFYNSKTVPLSKKKQIVLYSGKGRKPKTEVKIKESNWKVYTGSSIKFNEIIGDKKENFKFEILEFAETASKLKYIEAYHQFKYDVFRNNLSLNGQIIYRGNKKSVYG